MKPVSHMWRKMGSFSASVSYISAKRNVIKPFQLHYAINCNHRTWPCKALQWKTPPVKLKNWMDKEVEEGKGRPVYFCFCGHDCACAHLYVCTLVKRAHLIHIKVPVCVFMFAWPISLQVCGRAGSSVSNRRGKRGQTPLPPIPPAILLRLFRFNFVVRLPPKGRCDLNLCLFDW